MAYVALGRRDWARPELSKLAAAAPANPLYPYWTARLDQDDGRYAAAVEGLQRATQLDRRYLKGLRQPGPLLRSARALRRGRAKLRGSAPAEPRGEAGLALAGAQPRPAPHAPQSDRSGRGPLPRVARGRPALPPGPLPARRSTREARARRGGDERARGGGPARPRLSRAAVRAGARLPPQRRQGAGRPRARALPGDQVAEGPGEEPGRPGPALDEPTTAQIRRKIFRRYIQ
jgi:hypothetical protein